MSKLYGMDSVNKTGHWLCDKCHTWNRDYGKSATKSVVTCPFCSNPKPDPEKSETAKGGKPTQVDKDLFNFMKTATLEQKTKIMKFIKDEF